MTYSCTKDVSASKLSARNERNRLQTPHHFGVVAERTMNRCTIWQFPHHFTTAMECVIKTDMGAYGEEWTEDESRRTYTFLVCLILIWIFLVYLDETVLIRPDFTFWSKLLLQNTLLCLVFIICGYSVIFKGLDESYSRKISHKARCKLFMNRSGCLRLNDSLVTEFRCINSSSSVDITPIVYFKTERLTRYRGRAQCPLRLGPISSLPLSSFGQRNFRNVLIHKT